jgi:hypothetical protein
MPARSPVEPLTGVLASAALAAAVAWLATATWGYLHPGTEPSLLRNTVPVALIVVSGLATVIVGLVGLAFSRRRRRFAVPLLGGIAALSAPLAITAVTFSTLNDWNFANRAFIGSIFPVVAAELDGDLPLTTVTPHYAIHHAQPLPEWEVSRLERQWQDLRQALGTEPDGRIVLYLDDAGTIRQRLGGSGASDGRLVFTRPIPAPTGCATALHEVAHSFMYTRRIAYSFPQVLDEGWARSHQGCSLQDLDQQVLRLATLGLLVPLERRLTAADFASPRYGGTDGGYAEAGSFVDYVIRTGGMSRFLRLTDTTGIDDMPAVTGRVYGTPFRQLEDAWLRDVARREGVESLRFSAV